MRYIRGESPERIAAWRTAAANCNVEAMLNVARIAARTPDGLDEAQRMLRSAVDHGSAEAMHKLGVTLWRRGERDEGEALIRLAALDGHQDAAATMGNLCDERGEDEEAARWYAMVAGDE